MRDERLICESCGTVVESGAFPVRCRECGASRFRWKSNGLLPWQRESNFKVGARRGLRAMVIVALAFALGAVLIALAGRGCDHAHQMAREMGGTE